MLAVVQKDTFSKSPTSQVTIDIRSQPAHYIDINFSEITLMLCEVGSSCTGRLKLNNWIIIT